MKFFGLIIPLLLLVGCASQPSAMFEVNYGDTKSSVIEKLGPPENRQFKEDYEAFQYARLEQALVRAPLISFG